jgi:hypothetical protein
MDITIFNKIINLVKEKLYNYGSILLKVDRDYI